MHFFRLDEYFRRKGFDRVHLRVAACCVSAQWLWWASCLEHFGCRVAESENGLRPAEIMELVCSPRAVLLAGVNSVNSGSFGSQTLSPARAGAPRARAAAAGRWVMDV